MPKLPELSEFNEFPSSEPLENATPASSSIIFFLLRIEILPPPLKVQSIDVKMLIVSLGENFVSFLVNHPVKPSC